LTTTRQVRATSATIGKGECSAPLVSNAIPYTWKEFLITQNLTFALKIWNNISF
jgi:hypothetical protein